jgi:hypothetical protein
MCVLVEVGSLETETAQGSTKMLVSPVNEPRSVQLLWNCSARREHKVHANFIPVIICGNIIIFI